MKDNTAIELQSPVQETGLESVLKQGAQRLLAQAIEAEVSDLLSDQSSRHVEGKRAVVRNGYLPERMIQTGLGDIAIKVPKVRGRSGQGVKFNSALVPPYLKRTQAIEELIPWLYLKGISTGDMKPALEALLGEGALGLSSNAVSRLKQQWEDDYEQWNKRDLSKHHYAYVWADGIYSNVRLIVTAQNKWQRLRGYRLLPDVIKGIVFKDGEPPKLDQTQDNSQTPIHQI